MGIYLVASASEIKICDIFGEKEPIWNSREVKQIRWIVWSGVGLWEYKAKGPHATHQNLQHVENYAIFKKLFYEFPLEVFANRM